MSSWKPVSPCPGPSSESVAMPRARKTSSQWKNSSFVESRPGISTTSGGLSTARGRRRLPTTRPPSSGASTRSAVGSSISCAAYSAAIACCVVARLRSASTTQTNLAKWKQTAARTNAPPALRKRPSALASSASARCTSPVCDHASSHSSQRSIRAVVVRKSLGSTPFVVNRGAQLSMAACTRASGTGHHLLEVESKVLQQDGRGVAPRRAGDRAAGVRRAAGLVQAGDRHAVLPPPRRRAQAAALGDRAVAAVEGAADHVAVLLRDVDRALDEHREDRVVGQAGAEAAHALELALGLAVLEPLPAVALEPRLRAQELDRVMPLGRARLVHERRRRDEQPRDVVVVAPVAQRAL